MLTHRLPYAPNRGDRIRAYHLIRAMTESHDVDLVSLVHSAAEESHAARMDLGLASVRTARVARWTRPLRAIGAVLGGRPLTHALLHAPTLAAKVAAAVDSHRPDLVFVFCSGVAPIALSPTLRDRPMVFDIVDVDSEKWRQMGERSRGPLGWIYRREARTLGAFERRMCEAAKTTLIVNAREAAVLERVAPGCDVRVVENGIDLGSFVPPEQPAESKRVIFTGVMNYAPNVEAALRLGRRIWPRLKAVVPDAELWIVGSHPDAAVKRLQVELPDVRVTGRVPEIEPYYQSAAVAAIPLPWARGVQNKVLEAVATGLPCVTTPVVAEGLPESVRDVCVVAESDETFIAVLRDVLTGGNEFRRPRIARADLDSLGWRAKLAGLGSILDGAVGRGLE